MEKNAHDQFFEQAHLERQAQIQELTNKLTEVGELYISEQEKGQEREKLLEQLKGELGKMRSSFDAEKQQIRGEFDVLLERLCEKFESESDKQVEASKAVFEVQRRKFIDLMTKAQEDLAVKVGYVAIVLCLEGGRKGG